jgi:hypothetical protein
MIIGLGMVLHAYDPSYTGSYCCENITLTMFSLKFFTWYI